jgi:hypothetical protein
MRHPKRNVHVVVTVDDDHLSTIDAVASALRKRGMKVESVLKATGLITGTCSKPVAELKKVRGVSGVEAQTGFHLAPPDSDVQ